MRLPRRVVAALLVASCVDVARPAARKARPTVLRQRAAETAAERARREALPRLEPDRFRPDSLIRVADDPRRTAEAGVVYALFGPLRAEVRGADVRVAPDVPADGGFVIGARAARAWVFVTDGGDVFASPTFLGSLRPIGTLACVPPLADSALAQGQVEQTPSSGRVVLQRGAQLAWTDGASLRFEADPRVLKLAWRDERWGSRIIEGQGIETTDDGGRTWRALQTALGFPVALAACTDGLFAHTTAGIFRVDERGATPSPTLPATLPASQPPLWAPAVGEALMRAEDGRYARAPRPVPRACLRDEPAVVPWQPPRLTVSFPVAHEPSGMPYNPMPPEVRAPLGPPDDTVLAVDETVMLSATGRVGAPMRFAWRSIDARGRYTARVTAVLPTAWEETGWKPLTATRQALLLESLCALESRGPSCPSILRVTAAGATPLPEISPFTEVWLAVAGDDGSFALLGSWGAATAMAFNGAFGPVTYSPAAAVVVSPHGAVTARIFSPRGLVGLGERGGVWGLVTRCDEALCFHGPDGAAVPFGAWRLSDVRHCVGTSPGAARLHLRNDENVAAFGCSGDCAPIAQAEGFTLRQDPGGEPCVERVLGVHEADREGVDGSYEQRQSVCFSSRGRPTVFIDRGDRVASTRAAVVGGAAVDTGY